MDKIILIFVVIVLIVVMYFLSKPKGVAKPKFQKKAEIIDDYKNRMNSELAPYLDDEKLLLQKKTMLIKSFANELNRNIFFDEDEVRTLIQELILYEIKGTLK